MSRRDILHEQLVNVLGSRNVYFQPTPNIKIKYPCIIYNKYKLNAKYADNKAFAVNTEYRATVIDTNSDSEIPDNLLKSIEACSTDRYYIADGLYHYVFKIQF